MKWVSNDAERREFLAANNRCAIVSAELPLRANLVVLENIAVVPQYRANLSYRDAADVAWTLLMAAGYTDAAYKRDPGLSHEERFVAKLLRVAVSDPEVILIDRPALQLPDCHYPPLVEALLTRLADHFNQCWIVDYPWNEPLYAPR